MTNREDFQFSERNFKKDEEYFRKQLNEKIKLLTNNTMKLKPHCRSFQFKKYKGNEDKKLYLNLVCQLHKDPKTNKPNEFKDVRLSSLRGLPNNKKTPFRYTKCYGCKKESYHGLNNKEKLIEYPERVLEWVNSRINDSIVENSYIVENSNDISTKKDLRTGNYYFYVKPKCQKHPNENLKKIKLLTLIQKSKAKKITERCTSCNREKRAPLDYHLWKDNYFVFRGNKNIELSRKTKYRIADEVEGEYPSLKYEWNGRQWVLKVKVYCKEHDIPINDYLVFNALLLNKISSKKCKKCNYELQSTRSRSQPSEIIKKLRESKIQIIRTYYSYVSSTNIKTKWGCYLHNLYCGYHKTYFRQSTKIIGQKLGCPDCKEKKRMFSDPQKDDNLRKTETYVLKKLGENKSHFKVHTAETKIGAKKQIWVNLSCTSNKHMDINNFWYAKEAINPEICILCRPNGDSIGETTVLNILLDLNESPKKKKMLDNCIFEQPLQADFYLKINGQKFIIEFDGEQHFNESEKYGGEKGLINIINRDLRKNDCAQKNNIHLLRIHYKELQNKDYLVEYIKTAIDHIKSNKSNLITWEFNNRYRQKYLETYSKTSKSQTLNNSNMQLSINNKKSLVVTTYLSDMYPQKVEDLKTKDLYYETLQNYIKNLIEVAEQLKNQFNESQILYTKKLNLKDSAHNTLRAFDDAWDQVRLCIDEEMSQ